MPQQWIVRVEGQEYGPVNEDDLREWVGEGRLIPANPVRKEGDSVWITAAEIAGIFPSAPVVDEKFRRRALAEIIGESFRIYRRGFVPLFCLALLVAVPSFILKLTIAYIDVSGAESQRTGSFALKACASLMLACVFISWPIFIAGLQFATTDLTSGHRIQLRELLRRAFAVWPRTARLCLAVYGAYLFWTLVPVLAIVSLAAVASAISVLVALLVLVFQVYMAGRLFVNFMFWQQTSVLEQRDGLEALRESKELARSRGGAPRLQRPLYRGAIIASFWLLLLLVISTGAELPFVLVRFQGITDLESAQRMMQTLLTASAPDATTVASYALSSRVHAALRPLLGIAFVLLYFDAKAEM